MATVIAPAPPAPVTATGPVIDIFSPAFEADPYPFYKRMRDEAPVFYSPEVQCYVVSRYADVAACLKNPVFTAKNYEFQAEPLHGRTFIQMDGAEHSKYRNIVAPSIRGHELMQQVVPIIRRVATEVYEPLKQKNRADFAAEFAARFPILVMAGLLGLEKEDEANFLKWYRTFVSFVQDLGRTPAITEAAFQTKEELTDYILPIIRQRRENPGKDLISVMCHSEIDGVRMSDAEIKAFVSLLITAGGESTDKMLSLMLRNLLDNPEQLEAVRKDPALLNNAFVESMRFTPVTQRIMRINAEDVEVAGTVIPAGSKVMFMLAAAQHDDRQFSHPERFDIFRPDLAYDKALTAAANHLAFGAGRHFCVGAMLAKVEIDIAFELLFEFADNLRKDYTEADAPVEFGVFTRGLDHLRIAYDVKG